MDRKTAGKLTIKSGLPENQEFYIKETFTIGRDINNTLSISKKSVSRKHAKIKWIEEHNSFYIFDEGSENGVIVNGRLILGNQKLENGDIIFIGDVEFLFETVPYNDDLPFEEEQKEVPEEGIGEDLTSTNFIDLSELKPDYLEKLRKEKPMPEWIWDDGPMINDDNDEIEIE